MEKWFYYSKNGSKFGPSTLENLQKLADGCLLRCDTILEKESGQQCQADEVLQFSGDVLKYSEMDGLSEGCTLILLPIFWPLALVLMWVSSSWDRKTKVFVTLFTVIAFIFLIILPCMVTLLGGNSISYGGMVIIAVIAFIFPLLTNLVLPLSLVCSHPLWSMPIKTLALTLVVLLGIVVLFFQGVMVARNLDAYNRSNSWKGSGYSVRMPDDQTREIVCFYSDSVNID